MLSTSAIFFASIGIAVTVTGGFVGYLVVPKIIRNRIEESVKLVEGSEAFDRWKKLPIPVKFKVYFFNVSNPDQVQGGAQPVVQEIGPYIYNQYKMKINVTVDGDILSYHQRQLYEFDEEGSAPLTDDDELTILNLPLMSVLTVAEYNAGASGFELVAVNSSIPSLFAKPSSVFLTTTPRDFLFDGIYLFCNSTGLFDRIVCNRIETQAPKETLPRLEDGRFRFTLLRHKNESHDGYYSIDGGLSDVLNLGDILAWENSETLNTWVKNSSCNNVAGSDASLFPPFIDADSDLTIFDTNICRSVKTKFTEKTEFSGLKAFRFETLDSIFDSPSNESDNECFCLNRTEGIRGEDGCLLDGAVELWSCQGAPVVLSLPHFYLANEVYQNAILGLNPNKSLHQMYFDLEPMTGTILRGSKRTQFNIFIRPIEHISLTANLPTVLMPVVWIDEGIVLTEELIDLLNAELFDVLNVLLTVRMTATVGGAILFVLGFIWLLMSIRSAKRFSTEKRINHRINKP